MFDGAYTDPIAILERVYGCVFAGVYATYYWQNTAWNHVNYEPLSLPPDQQPHLNYYRNLCKLFDEYAFNELSPFRSEFAPPALADGQGLYLFYVARDRRGIFCMVRQLAGKPIKVRWFDPLSGEFIEDDPREIDGAGWVEVARPTSIESPTVVAILSAQ